MVVTTIGDQLTSMPEKWQEATNGPYNEVIILEEREMLLVPVEFGHVPFSALLSEPEEPTLIPKYHAPEGFMKMIHVALKMRSDILSHPS